LRLGGGGGGGGGCVQKVDALEGYIRGCILVSGQTVICISATFVASSWESGQKQVCSGYSVVG
jgi:hypothetical protein